MERASEVAPWGIFARKRLEITYSDVIYAVTQVMTIDEATRASIIEKIENLWSPDGHGFVCLSVRTGYDLILQSMAWPQGSEIIMTGVSIADMVKITEHHGLNVVPVDVSVDSLNSSAAAIEAAITPRTKAVMVVHIFGARSSIDAILEVTQRHQLMLLEDLAEAYTGPGEKDYRGHPDADASFFSFGSIKTATALGGALFRIKDEGLLEDVRKKNVAYSIRSRSVFLQRLIKYSILHGITTPAMYGVLVRIAGLLGKSHDEMLTAAIRGFSSDDFFSLIRLQASTPLLSLLWRRLTNFDPDFLATRKANSQKLARLLHNVPGVQPPGETAETHAYWLFPVMVKNPQKVCRALVAAGFDVTTGATQLGPIDKYVTKRCEGYRIPHSSIAMMSSVVYLPSAATMPDWALERLARLLKEATVNDSFSKEPLPSGVKSRL